MITFPRLAAAAWLAVGGWALLERAGIVTADLLSKTPLCLFHALTGAPCPGCGMTRGLVAAFQGRWAQSLHFHPLALPLLAIWTAWLSWGLLNAYRGLPFSQDFPNLARGAKGWVLLALVLAVYAARLA